MTRRSCYLAAAALLALFVAAGSIEQADARPLPAHHVVAGFGVAHCLPSGVWQATLTVGADVAGGTATIETQSTPFHLAVPGSFQFTIAGKQTTYTVVVTVHWDSDGFTAPPVSVTATRPPDGCTVATTSTTICAQANPPRADCNEVTTSTSTSTSVAIAIGSTSPSSSPTATDESNTTTTAASTVISPRVRSSSSTSPTNLPVTGPPDWPAVAATALTLALSGTAITLTARRRGA